MQQYLDLMRDIAVNGVRRQDRTGTGTLSVFGRQMRFDLNAGFPILTTKKIHWRSVVAELLWFLSGNTNVAWLHEHGCRIWDPWADDNGDLGPVYGHQWRSWPTCDGHKIDQISQVVDLIRRDPMSRRMLVVAWNPADLPKMALPPCHCLFQFFVADGKLSCLLYQRSCDVFIGLGFNIASYALLTSMLAQQCGLGVGEFVWMGGDVHLYSNHLEMMKQQVVRAPLQLPQLVLATKPDSIFNYRVEDIRLNGYVHHPHIKATVAV